MAYQSKYTGLEIDDILDSVEWKQGKIEDLASIRAGAQKGATALQSYTEKYTGTVTGIKLNGVVKSGSGVIDLGTVITSHQDISGKQDKLVSGTSIKTINGTSLLGSGNIEIESGGEANVQSDWLETNSVSDSYVKNRTHYVEGTKISTSGSHWIGLNTPIYYREKVYNLEVGVRTQIDTNAAGVYVTLSGEGVLNVEDVANLLSAFPIIAVSKIVPLDDMFIPEHIVREENIKTINGESIVGSGDLTIEGGAKIYTWSPTITSTEDAPISGTFTEEEYYNILNADVLYIKVDGQSIFCIARGINSENGEGIRITGSQITTYADIAIDIFLIKEDGVFTGTISEPIPSKTSQLENDSNFISSDGLKTINGESIVGSGNIEIGGGGGSSSGSGAYSEVNHGTSDTAFTLTPNTFHVWDEIASLTLDFGSETAGVANEYLFQFTSGATATSLTLPDDIKWANDSVPTIAENKIYQVSILKGMASVLEFSNAPLLIENKVTVSISGTKYLVSLQYAAASDIVVKVKTADGLISVNILSGEISKTVRPAGPMADSGAYIESIVPAVDTTYNYVW